MFTIIFTDKDKKTTNFLVTLQHFPHSQSISGRLTTTNSKTEENSI